jgi:hypothetical protein
LLDFLLLLIYPGGMSWQRAHGIFRHRFSLIPLGVAASTSRQRLFVFFILWPTRVGLHRLQQKKWENLTGGKEAEFHGKKQRLEVKFPAHPAPVPPELMIATGAGDVQQDAAETRLSKDCLGAAV